jgi:hypothetical protein
MSDLLPFVGILLLFVLMFVGIGGIVFLGVRSRVRRFERGVQAMQAVANQMGWQFSRDLPWSRRHAKFLSIGRIRLGI